MTEDILTRMTFSEESQFRPLALAPGLAMLDPGRLTYQVLLEWFGDLLAEPEFTDEGVVFHVQKDGQRQTIAERALATTADLTGPLAREYGQLKKFLFDARPVSPREQLVFSQVQLPIENHDGSLYRVRCHGGTPRLVWCWGFQRRFSDAPARLCADQTCSQLFLQQDESVQHCPRCGKALSPNRTSSGKRSEFPLGAAAAVLMLGSIAAATYCLPVATGAAEFDHAAGFSGPASDGSLASSSAPNRRSVVLQEPGNSRARTAMAEQGTVISEDSVRLKSADEPAVAVSDSETQRQTAPPERKEIQSNPVEESGTRAPVAAAPENAARPDPPEPIASPSRGSLDWFSDYRTAYSTAIAEHSRLVMLFVEPTADSGMPDALAATETEPLLKPFVRLKLPVDATVDGSADRLLAHRSFRHLGGQPGLVIVEFSDPQSPLSGQVVSALPLPDDGQFPLQVLKQLLVLPAGSIGQRSLLLAIRSGFPSSESNFPPPATHPVLNALANRNVRFMADSGRVDLFEQEQYRETVRRTFGDAVQARELLFATTESVSIQTAAEQAVAQWNQQPDTVDTVITSATAYGLDLFQAPASGRWFATLVVVK